MAAKRWLIVNADDFGQSPGVNRGVIEAYERGIVTSASLIVRCHAAAEAAAYAREHPNLSLGLHLDFGEWAYQDENWVPVYEVTQTTNITAVTEEVAGQLATFRQLVGQNPTHLDSHQHAHRREPILSVLIKVAHRLGVPLRHYSPRVRYCGGFYGQTGKGQPLPDAISVGSLLKIVAELPPGVTELACHPGVEEDIESAYRSERIEELKVLCDSRVRAAIIARGVELCSFSEAAL